MRPVSIVSREGARKEDLEKRSLRTRLGLLRNFSSFWEVRVSYVTRVEDSSAYRKDIAIVHVKNKKKELILGIDFPIRRERDEEG